MELNHKAAASLVRRALVEALALEMSAENIVDSQPLYEHPIAMDSLGFLRVIVEIEVQRGGEFDVETLEGTLFETVGDLIRFVSEQPSP